MTLSLNTATEQRCFTTYFVVHERRDHVRVVLAIAAVLLF
jgi:hypothetical protein